MNDSRPFASAPELLLVSAPLWLLLGLTLLTTGGRFAYPLDDPYIHLALAENLAHLHYGLHPTEYAAPSSSILWPFLLAPLSVLPGFALAPLGIGAGCCVATVLVIRRCLEDVVDRRLSLPLAMWMAACLNIYGLPFTGMEHSLQVLLAAWVAQGVLRDRPTLTTWMALLLLPAVRYEGLAITVPVLAWFLAGGRHRRAAAGVGLGVTLIVAGFSVFLRGLGLGVLPSSVLVKHSGASGGVVGALKGTILGFIENMWAAPTLTIVLLVAASLCLVRGAVRRRLVLLGAPLLLHLVAGREGWFGRYEVYIALYASLLAAVPLLRTGHALGVRAPLTLAAVLLLGTTALWRNTPLTPLGARNIADQQLEMGRFVRDHLKAPVAVNDLGAVSFFSPEYVLDLYGLGSYEAAGYRKAGVPSREWAPALMEARGVRFALLYDAWFPDRPADWIRVGELVLPGVKITPAYPRVALYGAGPEAATTLRSALEEYVAAHPDRGGNVAFEEAGAPTAARRWDGAVP